MSWSAGDEEFRAGRRTKLRLDVAPAAPDGVLPSTPRAAAGLRWSCAFGLFGLALGVLALQACQSFGGALQPGHSTRAEVYAAKGRPAMRWVDAEGNEQLSYPTGPSGYLSYMVYLDPAGRVMRVEQVLREKTMDRISAGMSEPQVVQMLGPSVPQWTAESAARDERVLEWRYCSEFAVLSRFDVLLDRRTGMVRSTFRQAEQCGLGECYCGHE